MVAESSGTTDQTPVSNIEAVQTKDGYDEMVKVLANAWSQETAIAQELKRIP